VCPSTRNGDGKKSQVSVPGGKVEKSRQTYIWKSLGVDEGAKGGNTRFKLKKKICCGSSTQFGANQDERRYWT